MVNVILLFVFENIIIAAIGAIIGDSVTNNDVTHAPHIML
jgi:uncharacterized membrane protein YcaP (DUF421 family)